MPNNGRVTECPFYLNERNNYITCEDAKRRFASHELKEMHMDNYCDSRWESCIYAERLLAAYEKEDETIVDETKAKALEAENLKVNIMLTKSENREKIKDREIKRLLNKNESLEKRYREYKDKYEKLIETEQMAMEQIQKAAEICEARVAFLLSERPDGRLDEQKFRKWHEEHEFCLLPEGEKTDDNYRITGWLLRARKPGKEDTDDGTERPSTESAETGSGEAKKPGDRAENRKKAK